MYLKNL